MWGLGQWGCPPPQCWGVWPRVGGQPVRLGCGQLLKQALWPGRRVACMPAGEVVAQVGDTLLTQVDEVSHGT